MKQVDDFICLSKIDEKIKDIESSRGDIPLRIDKLEKKKAELIGGKELLANSNVDLSKEQNTLKGQMEDSQVKLEKYKDQLFLVKNNKEYDALNSEIDLMKDELFKINERLTSINSDQSNNEESLKLSLTEIDECEEKLKKLKSILDESMKDEQSNYDNLKKERDKLVSKLDKNHLNNYDKMFNSTGYGMVPLSVDACISCYTVLPAQLITEIKLKEDFKNCPSCGVLLYYEG